MKPKTVAMPAASRPNRVLVALAAAWMILTLAFGGAVNAETPKGASAPEQTITGANGR
jgi:hypothetical protein